MPTLRAIGSGRIDTGVCNVTAGASSSASHGTTRPGLPEQSRGPPARTRGAQPGDLQHIAAIRQSHGGGIVSNGDFLSLGMIPTTTAA
jgi:hypothetical protein